MTIHNFNLLSEEFLLTYVYREGQYIARRWHDVHQAVQLFRLPEGFFAELNYDVDQNKVTRLFSCEAGSDNDRLEGYAMFVNLPDWLPETE